ncbi:hypothetical protein HK100_009490 [Physocladia obscura]|uniref:Tetratricopeptide repeat protein 29 n=1 Tax=Physocladia obscura TaxID=109957 RepID=A0AAD5T4Y7_9FUNG|nr:hypothetical protein HK100_009490 [Physocladia obscura]
MKVVYALARQRHVGVEGRARGRATKGLISDQQAMEADGAEGGEGGPVDVADFGAQVKRLVRTAEAAEAQKQFAASAAARQRLVRLFEAAADAAKIVRHANALLSCAAHIKGEQRKAHEASAILSIGRALLSSADFDEAISYFDRYLLFSGAFADESQNREISFTAQFNLGLALLQRGEFKDDAGDKSCLLDFEASNKRFLSLYARFEKEKTSPSVRGDVLMNLGITFGLLGRLDKALSALEKALKIARDSGDLDSVSSAYVNLGGLFRRAGRLDKALEYLRKEQLVRKELNDIDGMAEAQFEIVNLLHQMHKYADAMSGVKVYLDMTKRLASNDLRDRGHDLQREIEASISTLSQITTLHNSLISARSRRAGKRAEFRILLEIANLRMSLRLFTEARKDYETLDLITKAIPVSAEELDQVTLGFADANVGCGTHAPAAVMYRSLCQRWVGLTKARAEVLWKLADCLSKSDTIATPLIECDRIGIHLKNTRIQLEAQQRLQVLYTRFKYPTKATTAERRVKELTAQLELEGGFGDSENAEDEEELEDVISHQQGDLCNDFDKFSGSGSEAEEDAWISRKTGGAHPTPRSPPLPSPSARKAIGGRTSAVVARLDIRSDIDDDINTDTTAKRPRIHRKIIPLDASFSAPKHQPPMKRAVIIDSDDIEEVSDGDDNMSDDHYMLTKDRVKHKRRSALDLLKEKKRRRDGIASPEQVTVSDDDDLRKMEARDNSSREFEFDFDDNDELSFTISDTDGC